MPFEYRTVAVAEDIDALGHVNNLVYVRWIMDAAVAHSTAVGFGPEVYLERRQVFVVKRHEVEYLRPALLGDAIVVDTRVTEVAAASSARYSVVKREDGVLLAVARTRWAYLMQETGRPARIPMDLRAAMPVEAAHEAWERHFRAERGGEGARRAG